MCDKVRNSHQTMIHRHNYDDIDECHGYILDFSKSVNRLDMDCFMGV